MKDIKEEKPLEDRICKSKYIRFKYKTLYDCDTCEGKPYTCPNYIPMYNMENLRRYSNG